MKAFMKGLLKVIGGALVVLFALMVTVSFGFAPLVLLLGWPAFLSRILPHVTVNPVMVGEGVLLVLILGVGVHFFLSWLYENYGTPGEGQPPKQRWRLKWSLSGLTIFLLMFVTSISVTGFVHQTAWLATSPEPIAEYDRHWLGRTTSQRMRSVGATLSQCQSEHVDLPKRAEPVELQSVVFPGNCKIQGPYKDGWGTPFLYTSNGTSYVLKSYGRNRVPGGGAGDFDDLIFSDGKFVFPITQGGAFQ